MRENRAKCCIFAQFLFQNQLLVEIERVNERHIDHEAHFLFENRSWINSQIGNARKPRKMLHFRAIPISKSAIGRNWKSKWAPHRSRSSFPVWKLIHARFSNRKWAPHRSRSSFPQLRDRCGENPIMGLYPDNRSNTRTISTPRQP